jgi:hypothetical protein
MSPEGTRILRKDRRKAWRGQPKGRRGTHKVLTTYGAGQRRAAWIASWRAARAAWDEAMATSETERAA